MGEIVGRQRQPFDVVDFSTVCNPFFFFFSPRSSSVWADFGDVSHDSASAPAPLPAEPPSGDLESARRRLLNDERHCFPPAVALSPATSCSASRGVLITMEAGTCSDFLSM